MATRGPTLNFVCGMCRKSGHEDHCMSRAQNGDNNVVAETKSAGARSFGSEVASYGA